MPLWDKYVISVYWSIVTVASVGYGDYHPVNSTEMVFDIFYMFYILGLQCYIIGNFTNLIVEATNRTRKYVSIYGFCLCSELSNHTILYSWDFCRQSWTLSLYGLIGNAMRVTGLVFCCLLFSCLAYVMSILKWLADFVLVGGSQVVSFASLNYWSQPAQTSHFACDLWRLREKL